ncbi:glutamine--fructose-6-phosphate transaminase (isomerizing) [Zhengella sp. ZM62]|uniref:glutamine--fructose-6-phosphate transaminase (isomerizing) n=1 Tax=Zhengella sedimenti TaxID=3390035 RepID=UPI003975D46F
MCGIFAVTGDESAAPTLLQGLKRLEYRGYDSAGLAIRDDAGLAVRKEAGNVTSLEALLAVEPATGSSGIAHTRWATHGAPARANSHPHQAPGVAVVHNGIVENHADLRQDLSRQGARFVSETDSEVIPWLVRNAMDRGAPPWVALNEAAGRLEGSYAIAMMAEAAPGEIFAARKGSPIVAGVGHGRTYLSSDLNALAGFASHAIALEDGDTARLTADRVDIRDLAGRPVNRRLLEVPGTANAFDSGDFGRFMAKEIFEQPDVIEQINRLYRDGSLLDQLLALDIARIRRINIVACGSSYFAGSVTRHWIQSMTGIECAVHVASEYRYENLPQIFPGEVAILISQSGETADTLAVLERLQQIGMPVIAIVNETGSTMARQADMTLPLAAGPEIGVASTKAFMAQLVVMAHLSIHIAQRRRTGAITGRLRDHLARLPNYVEAALHNEPAVIEAAASLRDAKSALFLGRGQYFPLACEGALKLKETSYIHAEAFPAGELKHGPLALVDEAMPVFALAGSDPMLPKLASNIREVAARGGQIHVIGDREAMLTMTDAAAGVLTIPRAPEFVRPMVATVPLQLLSFHTATMRGLDVDRPRNLAKSVTVE